MRRPVLAAVLSVCALLGALLAAPSAQALNSPPIYQRYRNDFSHLCMAPAGQSTGVNVGVVQSACDGVAATDWITATVSGISGYQIKNLRSGLCLSPAGGGTGLNGALVQYTCDQDPARFWNLNPTTSETFHGSQQIRNVDSNLCMSPAGGSAALNTALVQYTCDGNAARTWKFFSPAHIQNTNSGALCLTIAGSSNALNASAVSYTCDPSAARLWNLLPIGSDASTTYYLVNVGSALCLTPAAGSTGINVGIVQYTCDSDPARAWRLVLQPNCTDELQNVGSGFCLSPAGGGTGLNNAMVQYTCDKDPSRVWKLSDV